MSNLFDKSIYKNIETVNVPTLKKGMIILFHETFFEVLENGKHVEHFNNSKENPKLDCFRAKVEYLRAMNIDTINKEDLRIIKSFKIFQGNILAERSHCINLTREIVMNK